MTETRRILRHFLAALAYRTQKALRDAPASFGDFQAGNGSRSPVDIVRHMRGLVQYSRSFFGAGQNETQSAGDLDAEIAQFHETLHHLSSDLESGLPIEGVSYEQLLQGPLSDAMTHAGQLAMLRRLAGNPVSPENFVSARIRADNVSPDQPPPT